MELPVVDKQEALARLDGDQELWDEIRAIWLADARGLFEVVAQAAESRSSESLRRAAHALKGASANVGAVRVTAAARELELRSVEADWDRLAALLAKLREETDIALRELPLA
jgi:HPt (histidine-containing phosphotransfer) domain-containing protein